MGGGSSLKTNIIDRNNKKSKILDRLASTLKISGIDYRVYYFSCNLEHVLHNEQNLEDNLKDTYADDFTDSYVGKEEFIDFIKTSTFSVVGDYRTTWTFIKVGENSLNRYSNFHLFFGDI